MVHVWAKVMTNPHTCNSYQYLIWMHWIAWAFQLSCIWQSTINQIYVMEEWKKCDKIVPISISYIHVIKYVCNWNQILRIVYRLKSHLKSTIWGQWVDDSFWIMKFNSVSIIVFYCNAYIHCIKDAECLK